MNRRNFLAATALFTMTPIESLANAATKPEGVLIFESTILEFDKVNSNNRLYPSSLLSRIPMRPIGMAVTNKMPEGVIVRFSDMIGEVKCFWWSTGSRSRLNELTLHARVKFFKPQNVEGMTLRTFGYGKAKWQEDGSVVIGKDFKLNGLALIPEKIACTW